MTEVPYLREIGYVSPSKSFNVGKLLLWLVGLIVVGAVFYRLFTPKKTEPKKEVEALNAQAFVSTGLPVRGGRGAL